MPWSYGSQHQLRRWILERPDEVNHELTERNPLLKAWAQKIEWISPTASTTAELRDQAWTSIGLAGQSPQQVGWWPTGGAVWDAVARVHGPNEEIGALFVEAKGRVGELRSGGSKATAQSSIDTIRRAFADVQASLGVAPNLSWIGACYQPANRLAMLWYARMQQEPHIPVWLVSLYFLAEHYPKATTTEIGPGTEDAWEPYIDELHAEMALPPRPHLLTDWWIEAFLPALQPAERLACAAARRLRRSFERCDRLLRRRSRSAPSLRARGSRGSPVPRTSSRAGSDRHRTPTGRSSTGCGWAGETSSRAGEEPSSRKGPPTEHRAAVARATARCSIRSRSPHTAVPRPPTGSARRTRGRRRT